MKYHQTIILIPENGKAPAIKWNLDFTYIEKGRVVYCDSKRRPIDRHERMLMRLWAHLGPGLLRVLGKDGKIYEVMPITK